jgi:tetratricopeptide (TPR) repeat protein
VTAGLRPLERCADIEALRADVEPPSPGEAPVVDDAQRLLAEARAMIKAGRYAAAQHNTHEARNLLAAVDYGPIRTELALVEGDALDHLGNYEASEAAYREALQSASRWRQREALNEAARNLLFVVGYQQRRMEQGLRYRELVRGLSRGKRAPEDFGDNNYALVLHAQGKNEEAEAEHRRALALHQDSGNDGLVAMSLSNLAIVLHAQGKYDEAEIQFRRALDLQEHALGSDHPSVAGVRSNLALILLTQGKHEEAEAEHRRVLALLEQALGPEHPGLAIPHTNLAAVLFAQEKYEEAEAEYRRALAREKGSLDNDHPDVALTRGGIASALHAQGKYDQAEAELRPALASLESALGNDHPDVAKQRGRLARLLLDLRRPQEALELAEAAWTRGQREDIAPELHAATAFVLARSLWTTRSDRASRTRAEALARDALERYDAIGSSREREADHVRTWLADPGAR